MTKEIEGALALQQNQSTPNLLTKPANDNAVPWPEILGEKPIEAIDQVAEIFAARFRHVLAWIDEDGFWRWYDKRRWVAVTMEDGPQRMTMIFIRELRELRDSGLLLQQRPLIEGIIKKLQSSTGIRTLEKLARTHLLRRKKDFDRQEYLLNVENGTVDLRTGELLSHDPSHLITRMAPVPYSLSATSPIYDQYLRQLVGEDEETARYLNVVLGYCLTGEVHGDAPFFFLHGKGKEGKSKLIELFSEITGDYSGKYPESLFDAKAHHQHPTVIMSIYGKRALYGEEWPEGSPFSASRLKSLSDGGPQVARSMHKDFQEFRSEAKFIQICNTMPPFKDSSDGYSRRIQVFTARRKDRLTNTDNDLPKKLWNEREGVLGKWIAGAMLYYREGLNPSQAVIRDTNAYIAKYRVVTETEVCSDFVDLHLVKERDGRVEGEYVYRCFDAWCTSTGHPTASRQKLYAEIERFAGHERKEIGGKKVFPGAELQDALALALRG